MILQEKEVQVLWFSSLRLVQVRLDKGLGCFFLLGLIFASKREVRFDSVSVFSKTKSIPQEFYTDLIYTIVPEFNTPKPWLESLRVYFYLRLIVV